ncbi:MAG: polyketide synthase, partial [Pseudomonadota bacterium]
MKSINDYKAALLKLTKTTRHLKNIVESTREPIAVVGMACRFPGAADNDDFWQLLASGTHTTKMVPTDRWDVEGYFDPNPDTPGKISTRFGCFIDDIDTFDAQFFGVSPKEVKQVDPQQRLLLEVSVEAIEASGIPLNDLKGSRCGVYIGIATNDYQNIISKSGDAAIGPHMGTGNAHSAAVARISYALGLEGPAVAVDTACSSSLVALDQALTALQRGACDLAITGGVNALLSPELSIYLSKGRFLAPDGRCKAFDASADGYVRGEGCGVVVLKRLSEAQRDGDRVLAVIRGSAVNQDGASAGLTVPNGPAQERVIGEALARADVTAQDIAYVEAHGTGTELGDPIEVSALHRALGTNRSPEHPLLIGSVKANIGHLEAAAGIAGVIKTILSLQHQTIPGQVHFQTPNPRIPWDGINVSVVEEHRPWPDGKALAGVSSFAFQGTNAHVVLEGYGGPQGLDAGSGALRRVALTEQIETAGDAVADEALAR